MSELETLSSGWGDPAAEKNQHSCGWTHVPARGKLRIAILSDQPVRYRSHWFDGQMRPCSGRRCRYCDRRIGGQTRYVVAAWDREAGYQALLELPARVAETVREAAELRGRLRGLMLDLWKDGGRERGRIGVEILPGIHDSPLLPAAVDVVAHLMAQLSADDGKEVQLFG